MSPSMDPREILSYLNELGYTNIEPYQLKAFMKDLKKLIKYEQRKQQSIKVPILYDIANLGEFAQIDSRIYSTNTTTSTKMEEPKMKQSVITVEVKRAKKRESAPVDECEHDENATVNNKEVTKSKVTEKLSRHSQETRTAVKPTASFIRPKIPLKKSKSDPVALYHKYQTEWKKIRFPGEDNRSQLRWLIREKMMGDVRHQKCYSTTASIDGTKKKSVSSHKV